MAKNTDRAKAQRALYGIVEKNVNIYARQKSELFNKKLEKRGWNKIYVLAALSLVMLVPLAMAVIVYKEGLYNDSPSYRKVNQAIIVPHAEEAMKEQYLEYLKAIEQSDSIPAVEKRRAQ